MKKNDEFIVEIIDNGFFGEGIAKIDGQVIFVPNTIKGEKVKIKILKVTSKLAYSKIIYLYVNYLYLEIQELLLLKYFYA